MWGRPLYLERRAGLPDMGVSASGPPPLTGAAVDAIFACDDPKALAELKAYAHSYLGTGGAVVGGLALTAFWAVLGRRGLAAATALGTGAAGLAVMEARRLSRQWEAAADARLAQLGSST